MTSVSPEATVELPHPFYLDEQGVNRPGPHKHEFYGQFAKGPGLVPISRTVNGVKMSALLVCRHADVKDVLRNPAFSRAAAAAADDVDVSGTMLGLDGDEHLAVRGIVKEWFKPEAVAGMRDQVHAEAVAQLQRLRSGEQPADLLNDFALPLSLNVICDLLGLPVEDRMLFRAWGDMFLGTSDLTRDQAASSAKAMGYYLFGLLEKRRQRPENDLLTQIARDGESLPPDQLVKLPLALIVGGWETAASSIAKFVWLLQTLPYDGWPNAWSHLVDHPDKINSAVTELERLWSTSTGDDMPRRALTDVTLPSGAHVAEGTIVVPSHDAANRDPEVFADPERVNFDRSPNPHLSYGYGAHHCIGAHLGGLEIRTAIMVLTRELPTLRLATPATQVKWKAGHSITSPEALPVRW